ncbi:MAG: pyridoxamine 5'-phosphate oxidase family protein [Candidatus Brocadiia bacterium]
MAALPENVAEAWENREGPVVLTTVDPDGKPNSIYAGCVSKYDDETLVVADNYFHKTRKNIKNGCVGALLFITEEDGAFQVKGPIEYHEEGPVFEDMKSWNPEQHPGNAAAALRVQEVYSGADQLL